MFDAESLEKWWTSALVFKLYAKTAGERVSKMLGMSCLPLKQVLKSDSLHLDQPVEVKDRSQSVPGKLAGQEPNWPLVGLLKVSVELASDSKDFATSLAATQLAEMRNPKIVPIPQPKSKPPKPKSIRARKRSVESSSKIETAGTQTEPVSVDIRRLPYGQPEDGGHLAEPLMSRPQPMQEKTDLVADEITIECPTLHTLLMVTEGKRISH